MAERELKLAIRLAQEGIKADANKAANQIEVALKKVDPDIDLGLDEAGIKQAERAIRGLADETVETAKRAKFLKQAYNLSDKEVKQVIREMDRLEKETKDAANAGGKLDGALAGLAGGAAFAALNALQNAIGEVLGLIGSIPGRLSAAADANADYERTLLGLDAQLRSAGEGVGLTRDELVGFASDLGEATLTSEEAVLRASRSLLSFRTVTDDTFTRAITISQDLAETLGGDLEQNVIQVGKALEDPVKGLTALSRSGTQFSAEQTELIKSLVESGNQLEAQNVILTELERQYGGTAAAAAAGLEGIKDTLGEFVNDATRNLGGALTPAFEGFNTLLMEIVGGLNDVDLGELTASSERLKAALSGNPETVEQIVDGFVRLAQRGVDGLSRVLDAITALTSNQDAIDSFTDTIDDFGTVLDATATGIQIIIALADGFVTLQQQAEGIPIIGGYLTGLLNPIGNVIDQVQGLKELGEEVIGRFGTNLIRIADIIGALPGFDDLAASARSLGQDLEGVATNSTESLSAGIGQAIGEAGQALQEGADQLQAPEIPPPSPPNLSAISDAYKQLTTELDVEQAKQRATLLENGGTQEEVAAQEQQFLQQRIDQANTQLAKLREINADSLNPEDAQALQNEILAIERQAANDRATLAQEKAAAQDEANAQEIEATALTEEQKTEIARQAAEERKQAEVDAAVAANELRQSIIDQEANLLGAQGQLSATLNELEQERLQTAIAQAQARGDDTEAARLTAQLKQAEIKAEQEAFDLQLRQLELQIQQNTLEAELELIRARANGASAEEIANLEDQIGLIKEIGDLQKQNIEAERAIAAENRQQDELQDQIDDQEDATATSPSRPSTASTSTTPSVATDELARFANRTNVFSTAGDTFKINGEEVEAALFRAVRDGAANRLPNIQPLNLPTLDTGAAGVSPATSPAEFAAPIVEEIRRLNANLAAVAQNPRSISITSESPFRDLSRTLREISDIETGGVNP